MHFVTNTINKHKQALSIDFKKISSISEDLELMEKYFLKNQINQNLLFCRFLVLVKYCYRRTNMHIRNENGSKTSPVYVYGYSQLYTNSQNKLRV